MLPRVTGSVAVNSAGSVIAPAFAASIGFVSGASIANGLREGSCLPKNTTYWMVVFWPAGIYDNYFKFLAWVGLILAPLCAVYLVDFHLLRRR